MSDNPKFNIEVPLVGEDGNAIFIIGRVSAALKKAGATKEEIEEYRKEAMSGDYDNVLLTTMRWVDAV